MIQKRSVKTLAAGIILVAAGIGMLIYTYGAATNRFNNDYYSKNFTTIDKTALLKIYTAPKTGVKIYKARNSVEFLGKNVSIPMAAGPKNAKSMYSFAVYGLINPTIIVRKDAKVTIQLVNEDDDMYHNLVVISDRPPYPYMSMMIAPAFEGSFIRPLPESSDNKYPATSGSFIASRTGTFYYICQIMGHASKGMYGKFVVMDNSTEMK